MTEQRDHDRETYEGPDRRAPDKHWHLDRRVPIAIIIALFLQACAAIWWAKGVDSDVEHLKEGNAVAKQLPERIAKLEGSITQLNDTLRDLREELRLRRRGQ